MITTVINKSAYSSTLKITSVMIGKIVGFWRALARGRPFLAYILKDIFQKLGFFLTFFLISVIIEKKIYGIVISIIRFLVYLVLKGFLIIGKSKKELL